MQEIIATIQGIWNIVGNYDVDTEVVANWWNEQYANLMEGFGAAGGSESLLAKLVGAFSMFMPGAAAVL